MKQIKNIILSLLLMLPLSTFADQFVHFDWSGFVRNGSLPEAAWCLDAEGGATGVYEVKVEYPEWVPMTHEEREKVKECNLTVPDEFRMQYCQTESRKQAMLDVALVPMVNQNGKPMKLKSCKLTIVTKKPAEPQNFSPIMTRAMNSVIAAKRYTDKSVLSTGKWAKIRVSEEGIYSLTPAFLKSLGFSNPNKVRLFGYGARPRSEVINKIGDNGHYDDLQEVPLMKRANDMIFYANGPIAWSEWKYNSTVDRYVSERTFNPYSSYSYYFVTEGDSAMAFPTDKAVTSMSVATMTTFPDHLLVENDAFSWLNSGRNLYDDYNYASGSTKNYTLDLTGVDTTENVSLKVKFSASNTATTRVQFSLNGGKNDSMSISKVSDQYTYAQVAEKTVKKRVASAKNTLKIKSMNNVNAHLDYILVNYTRKLQMTSTFLPFTYYNGGVCTFRISGCNASTQVWRIGIPDKPTAVVPTTLKEGNLEFKLADNSVRYIAVNTAGTFPVPEKVGSVANQNLHGDAQCDMVIIVPESGKLMSEANRLADYHRQKDSMRVNIVRADWLYNEFSSGTPDAIACRKYLKMLYDRAKTEADMPRYLILFGSCVWDNRMLTSTTKYLKPQDYLLAYESDDNAVSEVTSYVSDDYFGLLGDDEGGSLTTEKIDVGIGRIPVTTADEARIVVDKTISYMNGKSVGNWKNNIYMIADDDDDSQHMNDADSVVKRIEENYPELQVKHVYLDAYKRVTTATGHTYPDVSTLLKNAMKKGALVMNFTGHGAPYSLAHEQILTLADFKEFASSNIPLWVAASCELTPYDMLMENIGETSLLSQKGAAIAFYSSARAAYSTYNRNLNTHFMKYVLGKDSKGVRYTLGDAARLTKVALVSNIEGSIPGMRDNTSNKLKYALMGDPAVTLQVPTYKVVIDDLNGKKFTDAQQTLKAGSVAVAKGHIESPEGVKMQNFNGSLTLSLMDNLETIVCKNNVGDAAPAHTYKERTKVLYEGSDSVVKGQFEIKIPVPLDINYSGENGRFSLYAVSNDKTMEANGMEERFTVGGTSAESSKDSIGPAMYVYLNDPDFVDGGVVNESPYFYAQLADSDGINCTGIGIGHDLELIIDGEEQKTYILNDYFKNDFGSYTNGTVSFRIPALEEGQHRLFFRVWDTKNNASSTILNFEVKAGLAPQLVDVKATRNPASTATTFIITYDRPETNTKFTVDVYDCFGRLWWTHEETASTDGYYTINWNLTSNNGVALPDGLYLYKVGISCDGSEKVSKTKKLIIRKQ